MKDLTEFTPFGYVSLWFWTWRNLCYLCTVLSNLTNKVQCSVQPINENPTRRQYRKVDNTRRDRTDKKASVGKGHAPDTIISKINIAQCEVYLSIHIIYISVSIPRSKCSAFPVHRSAHFRALQWYASLKVHRTSLSSALHSPLKCNMLHLQCIALHMKYTDFTAYTSCASLVNTSHCSVVYTAPTLQCGSVLAAYALQRSCSALKYCTARHCQCTAGALHFDLGWYFE